MSDFSLSFFIDVFAKTYKQKNTVTQSTLSLIQISRDFLTLLKNKLREIFTVSADYLSNHGEK